MKFLHAADLHIDSPLKGLDRHSNAPAESIRQAPRDAFRKLIDLALEKNVDFVVLAGDIFDGRWKDISTGIFFVNELERLAPTPVYIVLGNHDSANTITSTLQWPKHVYRFASQSAQTYCIPKLHVALHGQSFASRFVDTDLAAEYPKRIEGMLNIGILHTSLEGHAEHASYAPTTLDVLVSKGYDAWCLGHIHERKILRETPLILYPGNIQGRHIKENGARGCYIIERGTAGLQPIFHPLDSFRWEHLRLDLSPFSIYEEVVSAATGLIEQAAQEHEGRQVCVRMTLYGASEIDSVMRSQAEDFRGEMATAANRNNAWLESVRLRSTRRMSISEAQLQGGVVGEIFRACSDAHSEGAIRTKLMEALKPLSLKIPAGAAQAYQMNYHEAPLLDEVIQEAEALLLTALAE